MKKMNESKKVKRRLGKVSLILFLIVMLSFSGIVIWKLSKAQVFSKIEPRYINNMYTTGYITTNNDIYVNVEDVDKSTEKRIRNICSDMVNYFNETFSLEISSKKAQEFNIKYCTFTLDNIMGHYDSLENTIYIRKEILKESADDQFILLSHELVHYLAFDGKTNGIIIMQNYESNDITIGNALNEGITQKITYDFCKKYVSNAAIEYYKSKDSYIQIVQVIEVLELTFGDDIYKWYFTNDSQTLIDNINNRVLQRCSGNLKYTPYIFFVGGIETLLDNVLNPGEIPKVYLDNTSLGILEELALITDKSKHDEFKKILNYKNEYIDSLFK